MSVYFIASADLIKIGYSNDVQQRVKGVISMLREGGEFLGCMPGGRDLEKHFHQIFADDRVYGEWFKRSERLLAVIQTSTTTAYPSNEKKKAQDRLQMQEERYAEEGAYFIQHFFRDIPNQEREFDILARLTTIPAPRLEAIYRGEVCPITAGEYVVLRTLFDAAEQVSREGYGAFSKEASAGDRLSHDCGGAE
jgi:hypothetical protein